MNSKNAGNSHSKVLIEGKHVIDGARACAVLHPRLLVLANSALEKVGLSLDGDVFHKVKGVLHIENLGLVQSDQETVSHKLNVLGHQIAIHPKQRHGQRLGEKILLDGHGVADDGCNALGGGAAAQLGEEQAGKVRVQPLVAGDELVGEGEAGHEAALLEPKDGGKRSREENALHARKGNEALGERGILVADPSQSPVCLAAHRRQSLNGVEEGDLFSGVGDICLDEAAVHFRVDVLHGNLKPVEASRLGQLHLAHEALSQVLVDNTIAGSEKGQHMLDKVLLVRLQLGPVVQILAEIHLLSRPKRRLCLLVHGPNLWVTLENHKAARVGAQQRLITKMLLGAIASVHSHSLELTANALNGFRGASFLALVLIVRIGAGGSEHTCKLTWMKERRIRVVQEK
eukprot:m.18321 g.18321  ORF g.18321 m.18321 type:complete len:401 (+) comp7333_c0_seq1:1161-2363(+)